MIVVRTVAELRAALEAPRARTRIGLVPTMGALHAGHVALCTAARAECGHVVMTVFVNPKQFNDPTDLAAYRWHAIPLNRSDNLPANREPRRMFGLDGAARIGDIIDGTSNTVMLVETTLTVKNGVTGMWGYHNHTSCGTDFSDPTYGINYKLCCSWNSPPFSNNTPNAIAHWGRPGSLHTGGCQVALGDGSVKFGSSSGDSAEQPGSSSAGRTPAEPET